MIQCPLCLSEVPSLKSNSHVIPRWIMKDTKNENGQNILLNMGKDKVYSNQKDLKGDFVCSKCEDLFRDFDTYGSRVYKLKQGFTKGAVNQYIIPNTNKPVASVQMINLNGSLLWKFFISVLVRHHIYSLKYLQNNPLGEKHYQIIRQMLFNPNPDLSLYPVKVFLHPEEKTPVSYPHSFKIDGITVWRFSGYNFTVDMYISSHWTDDLPEISLKSDSLIMIGLPFKETHLFQTMLNFSKNHQTFKPK